jgi:peptidoglycan/LPS O-acetylase OafA/YrhL
MHRNDIDGLRTFAVLPVIAFHFEIFGNLTGGGFIGVDVFFVISGYLITNNIYTDINNRNYSITDFYNRRMRRIFPALYTLYIFCIFVTFFLSFPTEAAAIGRSIISSIFFVSNVVFYSQSGYFNDTMESNPLLHTWSLSVEEQFYIILPLIIYSIRNFNHKTKIRILLSIALFSFSYCVWMVHVNVEAAFYLIQFRAWELLIGSLLAVDAVPKFVHRWQAELTGAAGLALIAAATILISGNTLFPGVATLAPCLGAAAVIHSGAATTTLVSRFLALSPIRFIGLISYSVYLWHWPVIVFYRLFINEPGRLEKVALVAVCILLATISWRFVEKPFRDKPHRLGAFGTLLAGAGAMISVSVIAIVVSPVIEKVWTYPRRATEVFSYAKKMDDESHMRVGTCFLLESHEYEFHYQKECLDVKPGSLNFLIIGDSYAAHLWSGLQTSYPSIHFLQATVSTCSPIIGGKIDDPLCFGMMKYIYEEFLPRARLNGIIISARWHPDTVQGGIETAQAFLPYADRVFLFGPIAEYDQPLPRILARAIASGKSESEIAKIHRQADPREIDRTFAAALQGGPVEYVSVYRTLCNQECEIWAAKDVPLQFDKGHLTREGSIALARKAGPQLFPNSSLPPHPGP